VARTKRAGERHRAEEFDLGSDQRRSVVVGE